MLHISDAVLIVVRSSVMYQGYHSPSRQEKSPDVSLTLGLLPDQVSGNSGKWQP